jgi:hypothetical protein
MRIFYSTQISNFTVKDGKEKFILSTDACMNLCVGIVSAIIDRFRKTTFLIAVPSINTVEDYKDYYSLFDKKYHSNIMFIEFDSPIGPVATRYHFDFNFWLSKRDLLRECDVMINDSNTLTKNWNALFQQLQLNIPIVSTNYFLDTPISKKVHEKIRYFERMMESFNNSDLTAFQCRASMLEGMEAYDLFYKDRKLLGKITVWSTGVWIKEVDKFKDVKRSDDIIVYFGNRITDTANRYNNYHKFAEAVGIAKEHCGIPFRAIMYNPTRKVTLEQRRLIDSLSDNTVEIIDNDVVWTRDDYLKAIHEARISCNLFTNEVHGGVTHCEAMAAKNIVIMPEINNYAHKYHEDGIDYPFFCALENGEISASSLAEKIVLAVNAVVDNISFDYWGNLNRDLAYKYESYEVAADRIMNNLGELVVARLKNESFNNG